MRPLAQRALVLGLTALLVGAAVTPAAAKPGPPRLFKTPPKGAGDEDGMVYKVEAEYRARVIHIDPLEVNGTLATDMTWGEQRLRLDGTLAKAGVGGIFVQLDLLDGVLFGDNGEFGKVPRINSGLAIASKQPNNAGWDVGLVPGGDALSLDGYGPVLRPIEPVRINYAYGEVILPFGMFRIGRQPLNEIASVAGNDGRSGRNRWGISDYHISVDRILFATKPSEAVRMLVEGDDFIADPDVDRGVLFALVYDFLVEDLIQDGGDDLHQVAGFLGFKLPECECLGPDWRDLEVGFTLAYRWSSEFNTKIFSTPFRVGLRWRGLRLLNDWVTVVGQTRELSAGLSKLTGRPIVDQDMLAWGSRFIADYELHDWTFSFLVGYASGDADPRAETPLTSYSWPRDTNLGLLLFEHTLAFQSARSAAVGTENLKQLEADSFPLTEVDTDGRATNMLALFPQVFWDPLPELRLKAGALFAWAAQPVTDPIQSVLAWDGEEIGDDAVNYNGGRPASYWGTELDFGVEFRWAEFFEAIVEAAVLFPGPGLEDENGDAVTSWLLETRFVFTL